MADLKITFDVNRLTAEDMIKSARADATSDTDLHAEVLAKACLSCPTAWGAPDKVETFAELMWQDFSIAIDAMRAATVEASRAAAETVEGVRCDFTKVKARDVGKFIKAAQLGHVQVMTETLPKIVHAAPGISKPDKPESYHALPYYPTLLPLIRQVVSDALDSEKKGNRRF